METQTQKTEEANETKKGEGLLFTGCMFIGMAAGWYFGNLVIGMFAGMGIGFILMAVAKLSDANRK